MKRLMLGLCAVLGLGNAATAADFWCQAGDVSCLVRAINTANTNGEPNTITLEAGVFALTSVDNMADGANGLPSITGRFLLLIVGAGPSKTVIERRAGAPRFRIFHVAAAGQILLAALTVTGGDLPFRDAPLGGGGILNLGELYITDSVISRNTAALGAGISNDGMLIVQTSHIINNTSSVPTGRRGGGGIANSGTAFVEQSTIANNMVDNGGGGGIRSSGEMTIMNSTIANNGGDPAGGISNSGTMDIINSTIANNSGAIDIPGGGISHVDAFGGKLNITNSTISGNRAGQGGGISGPANLLNTILAGNFALSGPDCVGTVTSLGNNLIGTTAGCAITLLPSDLTGDPGLRPFTDTRKPGTGHFPLQPSSRAIDAADKLYCPKTDQLGRARVGPCDIGSIEFQPGEFLASRVNAASPLGETFAKRNDLMGFLNRSFRGFTRSRPSWLRLDARSM